MQPAAAEPRTQDLFRHDAYLRSVSAEIIAVTQAGLVLDKTVFYPSGGGQPGDSGTISADGVLAAVSEALPGDPRSAILHRLDEPGRFRVGDRVQAELDWDRRYRHMRMHTCLHLLSVALPYPVTGGQIGAEEGRLDFDIPDAGLDKDEIGERLNALIFADHAVTAEWIADEELDANPGLVKTLRVKPPRGSGRVRLVRIGPPESSIDLQPCGGTHVARTGEIGRVMVTKIEKKGAQNRRVRVAFAG